MAVLGNVVGILAIMMFFVGLAFLIAGIVGTIITGKVKGSPKVLRVLSIIALVIGIGLCVLAVLIPICVLLFSYM
jgi:hypothetical protein